MAIAPKHTVSQGDCGDSPWKTMEDIWNLNNGATF